MTLSLYLVQQNRIRTIEPNNFITNLVENFSLLLFRKKKKRYAIIDLPIKNKPKTLLTDIELAKGKVWKFERI